ncbi:MAG: exodeoxyribonuclease VII large subunit [Desulfovibrio sp.]|nr:exodeoxyribonuclease VII large subunit [Desulfovibrio sp.]
MLNDTAILGVRELTERLRGYLEGKFPFVWVRGEVSNLSRPSSGHIYFSLKDQDAQLQCVWFRQRQQSARQGFDPLTGEVLAPGSPSPLELLRNGLDVLCAGHITVYASRGQYQLVVELVQPSGEGMLAQAFEAARRRLAAQGYFSQVRKRPLPFDPQRVALITSPSGAAIHDFFELAAKRGSGARIRLFPALVQGEGAAPSVVRAMEEANAQGWAQVVVLIRGGGSLEDLWTFNEEAVATAVFRSRLPVLAGIGHEVDVTLADMTADVRAATPSHAAQLLWPSRVELTQRTDEAEAALCRAAMRRIEMAAEALKRLEVALRWLSPRRHQNRLSERLGLLVHALERAVSQWLHGIEAEFRRLDAAGRSSMGMTRLEMLDSRIKTSVNRLEMAFPRLLCAKEQKLNALAQRLAGSGNAYLERWEHLLQTLTFQLSAGDPLTPLKRGYALVHTPQGDLLRSVEAIKPGMAVEVRLIDGMLDAMVMQVRYDTTAEGEN